MHYFTVNTISARFVLCVSTLFLDQAFYGVSINICFYKTTYVKCSTPSMLTEATLAKICVRCWPGLLAYIMHKDEGDFSVGYLSHVFGQAMLPVYIPGFKVKLCGGSVCNITLKSTQSGT